MKHMYYFSITIDGFTSDRESVKALKRNLDAEVWWQEAAVGYPVFREVPENKEL